MQAKFFIMEFFHPGTRDGMTSTSFLLCLLYICGVHFHLEKADYTVKRKKLTCSLLYC